MRIIGTGSAHPKHTLTNVDLSKIMDTSDEWIRERTGICTRQIITDENLEDLAAEAAQKALHDAGMKAADIDYIICSNVVFEYVTPSVASIVEGKIGASCPCVDLNAACSGFIYAIDFAEALLQTGRATNILVMAAEEPTRMVDWNDRSTCVLFGDGAGAMVVTRGDGLRAIKVSSKSNLDVLHYKRKLEPTPFITKEEEHIPLYMAGQEVFKTAVTCSLRDLLAVLSDARFGNPTPRIAECNAGMINAVGLQNPGVDKVISEELPRLKTCFNKKVMANVSGFSVEDYAYTCERLDKEEQVGWLEVNVSCPNVHGGGMSFGTDPSAAAEVTRAVKAVTAKPVIIKFSPNVTDIVSIAKACEDAGADGISLINTLLGMRIDLKTKKPVIANKMGGFSGPAILPVAVRMVYQVANAVNIPIVGMGGVSCAEDVIELMLAGASAVEVGAANLTDPYICRDIINDLPRVMDKYGIKDLKSIIGGAK